MMKNNDSSKGVKTAIIFVAVIIVVCGVVLFVKEEAFKNPALADYIYCYQEDNVKGCVRGLDETSFCKYKETKDVKCTTSKLKEKQFVITEQ